MTPHCGIPVKTAANQVLAPRVPLVTREIPSLYAAHPNATGTSGACGAVPRMDAMLSTAPPDYRPTDTEEFMSPRQLAYFRQKLLTWRGELVREAGVTLSSMSDQGGIIEADLADRASVETDRALELRTRDRARKLISKIDGALERVDNGTYGYCEETGEPIGLRRLEARPIATLSIEAQERHERMERIHRDD